MFKCNSQMPFIGALIVLHFFLYSMNSLGQTEYTVSICKGDHIEYFMPLHMTHLQYEIINSSPVILENRIQTYAVEKYATIV